MAWRLLMLARNCTAAVSSTECLVMHQCALKPCLPGSSCAPADRPPARLPQAAAEQVQERPAAVELEHHEMQDGWSTVLAQATCLGRRSIAWQQDPTLPAWQSAHAQQVVQLPRAHGKTGLSA